MDQFTLTGRERERDTSYRKSIGERPQKTGGSTLKIKGKIQN